MKAALKACQATLLLVCAAPSGGAAVLTSVDMGGSMIHANIAYDAVQSLILVHVDTPMPQLTPLDVTNPADNFAPGDPWFDCLDPSRRGMAFSRQYGFVMDGSSDPLPSPMGIWIRERSATPGLEFYRYRSSAGGKSWDPMFGTAGATNLFIWNRLMFHPAIAAPPASGTHSARLEAFAVDETTGQPWPGVAPGQFTLEWTIVPSARPTLELGRDFVLRWPASATNYVLKAADSPNAGTWDVVTSQPTEANGVRMLSLQAAGSRPFYRLQRVP